MSSLARELGRDHIRNALRAVTHDRHRDKAVDRYFSYTVRDAGLRGNDITGPPETIAATHQVMHRQTLLPHTG